MNLELRVYDATNFQIATFFAKSRGDCKQLITKILCRYDDAVRIDVSDYEGFVFRKNIPVYEELAV